MEFNIVPRYSENKYYMENRIIEDIRTTFGLNEPPFNEMDDDLLLLAFIPTCQHTKISPTTLNRLKKKYGSCVHQTLEFYGDRVFYAVISSILYEIFGLENNQKVLTQITNYLASNRFLTDLMLNKEACNLVRYSKYTIKEHPKVHNICADSFEALIGTLFIYLKDRDLNYVETIKRWVVKNTHLPFFLNKYLRSIQDTSAVYTIPDKERLIRNIKERQNDELSYLESLKKDLDPEEYQVFREEMENNLHASIEDFASRSLIINHDDSLSTIYRSLKWEYQDPIYSPDTETYHVVGFPNGKEKIIGTGLNEKEAESDALQYLIQMGYIILTKPINTYFTIA